MPDRIHPLHLAVALLVSLGVLETVALISAVRNDGSFSGGSLLYLYVAWLLWKRSILTYNLVLIGLSAFLALLVGGAFAASVNVIQFLLTPGLNFQVAGFSPLLVVGLLYLLGVPLLLVLLLHPATRQEFGRPMLGSSPWTLYLPITRLVVLSLIGVFLGALLIGPHLHINPYQLVASSIKSDATVTRNLGFVKELALMDVKNVNYQFSADLKVVGEKNSGFYYADVSPDQAVKLTNYGYAHDQDAMLDIPRASDVPILPESGPSYSGTAVTLISTSFEANTGSQLQIFPFIQDGPHPWGSSSHAHSGQVAVNAIPKGNPGDLRYFNKPLNAVLLNSQLKNEYASFDVEQFKQVELSFWRLSTSNPSETHNCLGSLAVEYRLDGGEWQHKMTYCGRNKALPREWLESQLTFDTAGHKEVEIRFQYEYPPETRKDATAVYLVDDLKVIGYP